MIDAATDELLTGGLALAAEWGGLGGRPFWIGGLGNSVAGDLPWSHL